MPRRKARRAVVSRNDGILLRRIAQANGIVVTHHANDGVTYTLRANGERIHPQTVRRLIDRQVLLAEDRGLLGSHPQAYRVRVPSDGKP